MNPTQNNYLLPLAGEEFNTPASTELATKILIEWGSAPIFRQMQQTFWHQHFSSKSVQELRGLCKSLGLSPGKPIKAALVHQLELYYKRLVTGRK